jgi:RHS repeat-associated protein
LVEATGLYYYGARYYDPRTFIWLSTDPLQEKYPHISTYTYCTKNPVKYIDSDGRAVKIPYGLYGMMTVLPLLHGTLTPYEALFVRVNFDGFIDATSMQMGMTLMGGNVSGNYLALMEIVQNDKIVEFSAPMNKTANDVNGKPVSKAIMAFQFQDPVRDEWNNYTPELQGGLGITLAPSTHQWTEHDKKLKEQLPPEQQYYSSNGNYQVQVNGRGLGNRNTFKQLVKTTAHELFGHLLMMFRGKDSLHAQERSGNGANEALENQIRDRVDEADRNLNM